MPATPARIAFIAQAYRSVSALDAAIKARYGAAARDTAATPVPTFFDTVADTQAMCDERFALLKADRRKFTVAVGDVLSFTGGLDFSQVVPTFTVVDDEKVANLPAALVGIESVDYETGKTTLTVWG
jgi:hypothetical protein